MTSNGDGATFVGDRGDVNSGVLGDSGWAHSSLSAAISGVSGKGGVEWGFKGEKWSGSGILMVEDMDG